MSKLGKNVVDIRQFRQQKKKQFLRENESQLRSFISSFLTRHIQVDFTLVSDMYLKQKIEQNEMAWDYHDLRDDVKDAMLQVYGSAIWTEIRLEPWFRAGYLSKDEVIDKATSEFVLLHPEVAGGYL